MIKRLRAFQVESQAKVTESVYNDDNDLAESIVEYKVWVHCLYTLSGVSRSVSCTMSMSMSV